MISPLGRVDDRPIGATAKAVFLHKRLTQITNATSLLCYRVLGKSQAESIEAMTSDGKQGREGRDSVRALERGLAILRFVNSAGDIKAGEIAKELGIPRPTVYRLLKTLEELGYIVHAPTSAGVSVTPLAASLGDGFARTALICRAAESVFAEYASQLVWPLDLSVYENGAMVVQETTNKHSALAAERGTSGYRLPMLRTSAGRAYLAYSRDAERRLIIDRVRRLDDPEDRQHFDPEALEDDWVEIRRHGMAVRESGSYRPKTSSMAIPVIVDGLVIACVSMIWIRSAMMLVQAIDAYEIPLRDIAAKIADKTQAISLTGRR